MLACAACNGDQSHALPAVQIVDSGLERDPEVLEEIARELQWPTQRDRVVAAARGVFRGQSDGVPTWAGLKKTVRLDLAFAPDWMLPG